VEETRTTPRGLGSHATVDPSVMAPLLMRSGRKLKNSAAPE
jgi:hypothetical protein